MKAVSSGASLAKDEREAIERKDLRATILRKPHFEILERVKGIEPS